MMLSPRFPVETSKETFRTDTSPPLTVCDMPLLCRKRKRIAELASRIIEQILLVKGNLNSLDRMTATIAFFQAPGYDVRRGARAACLFRLCEGKARFFAGKLRGVPLGGFPFPNFRRVGYSPPGGVVRGERAVLFGT